MRVSRHRADVVEQQHHLEQRRIFVGEVDDDVVERCVVDGATGGLDPCSREVPADRRQDVGAVGALGGVGRRKLVRIRAFERLSGGTLRRSAASAAAGEGAHEPSMRSLAPRLAIASDSDRRSRSCRDSRPAEALAWSMNGLVDVEHVVQGVVPVDEVVLTVERATCEFRRAVMPSDSLAAPVAISQLLPQLNPSIGDLVEIEVGHYPACIRVTSFAPLPQPIEMARLRVLAGDAGAARRLQRPVRRLQRRRSTCLRGAR